MIICKVTISLLTTLFNYVKLLLVMITNLKLAIIWLKYVKFAAEVLPLDIM